jgi:hypothetical protein
MTRAGFGRVNFEGGVLAEAGWEVGTEHWSSCDFLGLMGWFGLGGDSRVKLRHAMAVVKKCRTTDFTDGHR